MNHIKQTHKEPETLTRSEKFFKRGLPVLATGFVALSAIGLVAQVVTNEHRRSASIAAENKKDQVIEDFNKMLDSLAITSANPEDVIPLSGFSIENNTEYIGEEAQKTAESINIDSFDTIADSALAISRANLVQPGSEFVLSTVTIGDEKEVIVQLAPTESDDK